MGTGLKLKGNFSHPLRVAFIAGHSHNCDVVSIFRQILVIALALLGIVSSSGTAICWEPDGFVHVEAGLDGRCFDAIARSEQVKLDSSPRERSNIASGNCVDAGTSIGQADSKGRSKFVSIGHGIADFPLMHLTSAMCGQMLKHTPRPQIPFSSYASSHLSSVILRT